MATTDDPNLERWHLIEQLLTVLHQIRASRLLLVAACISRRVWLHISLLTLLFSIVALVVVFIGSLLAPLQQKGLLIEDEIVEDAGKEDAFKHDQVTNNFTGKESVLKLLVLYEVIEPLFAKSWHSAHLEEVA